MCDVSFSQFKSLSYFDRHNIATDFYETMKDLQAASPASFGVCTTFPTSDQVSLLFQLLLLSGNITDTLEFMQLLLGVVDVIATPCMASYPSKLLQVAAMARRHFACVIRSTEIASAVFTEYVGLLVLNS